MRSKSRFLLLLLDRVGKGIQNLLVRLDNLLAVLLFPLLLGSISQLSLAHSAKGIGAKASSKGELRPGGRDPKTHALESLFDLVRGHLAALDAVGDNGGGLAVPLVLEVVDGVLCASRDAVVVLGGDEDVGVVGGDLGGPLLGVVVDEGASGGDVCGHDGLVKDGQLEGVDVDDGEG